MASVVRRSILMTSVLRSSVLGQSVPIKSFGKNFVTKVIPAAVAWLLIGVVAPAFAQHVNRVGGSGVHVSAPPPPAYHAPSYHPLGPVHMATAPMVHQLNGTSFNGVRFRRPIRPMPPVFIVYAPTFLIGGQFWGSNICWWATCDLLWGTGFFYDSPGYGYGLQGYAAPLYQPPVYQAPIYGDEGPEIPQLFLKDGTVLNVSDYWVVDDQMHFTMTGEDHPNPVEQVIPFDELDLQKTIDANARRGFRFVLRNEPFEQYLRDHPDGPPPALKAPQ